MESSMAPRPEPPRYLTVEELRVSSASSTFGIGLLREVHAAEAEPNLLLSPLSASMALGMTMNGARTETLAALRRTLGFGELEETQINEAYAGLIRQLRARDPKVEFRLGNSIWHDRDFVVEAPFLATARQHFDAEVRGLDFGDARSPATINAWAEQATGGRIKELIESIDPLEKLFLVNAVYFKAPWTTPFNEHATRSGPFTRLDGSVVQVPLMSGAASYFHFRDDAVEAAELLYADSAFAMTLIIPAGGASLDGLVASLTPERWNDWISSLAPGRLMLTMPKFRLEYGTNLNDPLAALGMGIAFRPQAADFSGISRQRDDVHITRVQQNTFIDVHELGTEAAAATAVGIGVTSMPPAMTFDRPFLLAIRERSSGTLLFLGRIGDPSPS